MTDTPETDDLLKINIPDLVDLCRKMERERNEWKEKAERLQAACNKWSESEMLLTNCPDCREFRGHGHECKSGQDTPITKP